MARTSLGWSRRDQRRIRSHRLRPRGGSECVHSAHANSVNRACNAQTFESRSDSGMTPCAAATRTASVSCRRHSGGRPRGRRRGGRGCKPARSGLILKIHHAAIIAVRRVIMHQHALLPDSVAMILLHFQVEHRLFAPVFAVQQSGYVAAPTALRSTTPTSAPIPPRVYAPERVPRRHAQGFQLPLDLQIEHRTPTKAKEPRHPSPIQGRTGPFRAAQQPHATARITCQIPATPPLSTRHSTSRSCPAAGVQSGGGSGRRGAPTESWLP